MTTSINKKFNFIVVGAATAPINTEPKNFETWNNPKQASYNDLQFLVFILKEKYPECAVCITLLDGEYTCIYKKEDDDITYINEYFDLESEPKYFKKDYLNIIIEFCNLLNESWVSYEYLDTTALYENVRGYNAAILACGCCWNKGFPTESILTLLELGVCTPMEPYNVDSYFHMVNITNNIKEKNMFDIMKPFIKGCFMVLGSLIYRGHKNNPRITEVIREFLQLAPPPGLLNNCDLKQFLNKEKVWNFMPKDVRLEICNYIYGMETDYSI